MQLAPLRRRRSTRVVFIATVLAVTATVLLLPAARAPLNEWMGPAAPKDAPRAVVLRQGPLERTVTATAAFQASNLVDVGAQLTGQLKSVEVKPGDTVTKGQLIAVIDDTLVLARLAQTKASLESVRAQRTAKEAQTALARLQLERSTKLMQRGVSSTATFQTAEAAVATLIAERDALQAQEQGIEAAIAQAQTELKFARIHAPMDGTVVAIVARPGQTLNAAQQAPTILRIADLGSLELVAQVSEADVLDLRAGMSVYFTVLGAPGRRWIGRVMRVLPSPSIINNVVLYDVLIEAPDPDATFRLQMTAQVFFVLEQRDCVLKLPRSALPRGFNPPGPLGLDVVAVVGEPRKVEVAIAVVNDMEAGIDCSVAKIAGLRAGDRVAPIMPASTRKGAK